MKKFVILGMILLGTSLSAQVKLHLKNTTGDVLKSATIGTLQIGDIGIDSTKIVDLPALTLDSGAPCCIKLSLLYKEIKLHAEKILRCGTEIRTVKEGTFTQYIFIARDEKGNYKLSLRNYSNR